MPVLSWGHSQYWQGTGGVVPPDPGLGAGAGGGYIPWATTVIIRGACQAPHLQPCR